jgi:hypothetical protein
MKRIVTALIALVILSALSASEVINQRDDSNDEITHISSNPDSGITTQNIASLTPRPRRAIESTSEAFVAVVY